MTIATTSLLFLSRKGMAGFATVSFRSRVSTPRVVERRMTSTFNAIHEAQLVQDMLCRIRSINQMPDYVRESVIDFTVDGTKLGKVSDPFQNKQLVQVLPLKYHQDGKVTNRVYLFIFGQ